MAGIKITREGPAIPLPTGLEVSGDVDGDNIDWPTGPGVGPGGSGSDDDCEPVPHGSMGSTETFDESDGEVHTGTLTADCTVTLTAPDCDAAFMEWWITEDGTGGWDILWPGSVTEQGTHDTTLATTQRVLLDTVDGGTTWIATWQGSGGGGGTPATTVESETAFGISPAVGIDTEYARQDHTHGTPDTDAVRDAGRWELAVVPGSPPDPLYADGDYLYIWVPG